MIAIMIATSCFGQYWNAVPSGTNKKLLSISFGNTTTGYIGGEDSLLLKTTDGGGHWHPVALTGISFITGADDIIDVDFVSATTGYITVTNHLFPYLRGAVYKTTDGAGSWTLVDAGNAAAYRSYFFSEGEGFIIGSAFFAGNVVSRLTAGQPAASRNFSSDATAFNLSVDFRNTQTGIIGGEHGQVYRTFNGGASWDTIATVTTDTAIYALRFLNNSTILGATVGVLIISFDTGRTWQTDFSSLTFDYPVAKSITRSAKDSFIAVGTSMTTPSKGIIYWHNQGFNQRELTDQPLYDVATSNDSVAYAVGDSGLILTNRTATVSIKTPSLLEKELKVYPNPGTGRFTTALPMRHTVTVYDLSGRMELVLDKPLLQQQLDLSAYGDGIYYLHISAGQECFGSRIVLKR